MPKWDWYECSNTHTGQGWSETPDEQFEKEKLKAGHPSLTMLMSTKTKLKYTIEIPQDILHVLHNVNIVHLQYQLKDLTSQPALELFIYPTRSTPNSIL